MDDTPPTVTGPDDDAAGWDALRRALLEADPGARGSDDVEWALREARMLVLDGRADLPSLVALARRRAFGAWPTLRDCGRGTAGHVLSVLQGWDLASVAGAGHAPGGRAGALPDGAVEVAAVWCAAAADRLGLGVDDAVRWAESGLFDPGDAPDPGWPADPDDGPDADPAPAPEDDETYRRLRLWAVLAGLYDAPACHRAGLGPEDAAVVLALPWPHPDRRRLLGY